MKTTIILVSALTFFLSFRAFGQNAELKPIDNSLDTTKFISYKMKYPAEARRKRIQGTVKVKVTFDAQCNIVKREVVKSLGYGCDEEALTALTNIEQRIKRKKENKCKDGEEMTYPFEFRLD